MDGNEHEYEALTQPNVKHVLLSKSKVKKRVGGIQDQLLFRNVLVLDKQIK